MNTFNKHYITINEDNIIIDWFSDAFKNPTETDICINEFGGRHFQILYSDGSLSQVNPTLYTSDLYLKYKYENGEILERNRDEIEGTIEFKERMHQQLKNICSLDISNLGEAKAQTLSMKKYMGEILSDEEEKFISDFLIARDNRLAQYELDKQQYNIN